MTHRRWLDDRFIKTLSYLKLPTPPDPALTPRTRPSSDTRSRTWSRPLPSVTCLKLPSTPSTPSPNSTSESPTVSRAPSTPRVSRPSPYNTHNPSCGRDQNFLTTSRSSPIRQARSYQLEEEPTAPSPSHLQGWQGAFAHSCKEIVADLVSLFHPPLGPLLIRSIPDPSRPIYPTQLLSSPDSVSTLPSLPLWPPRPPRAKRPKVC